MTINISGQVPSKEKNGMYELEEDWTDIEDPDSVICIAVVSRDGITIKKNGDRKAVMKFDAIEPIAEGPLAETVKELLQQARQAHTGEASLDLFPAADLDDPEDGLDEPEDPFDEPSEAELIR